MYNGTLTPGTAQTPASQNQIDNMYAIAAAIMKNQQPTGKNGMQSWLQPMAQMANAAVAAKYWNAAQAADQALTRKAAQPPPPAPGVVPPATPVSQPGMVPGGQVNPLLALYQSGGITGDPNATPAAGAGGSINPIAALFSGFGGAGGQ